MLEEVVDFSSKAAAHWETRKVWVSRHGQAFLEEDAARYHGCTHRPCMRCGQPAIKSWTWCDDCRRKQDDERWAARPRKAWGGDGVIYSQAQDRFYEDWPEDDDMQIGETLEDLRLVICEPVFGLPVGEDHFYESLGDDGDLPDAIFRAIDAFNAAIKAAGPLSWQPGEFAVDLTGVVDRG